MARDHARALELAKSGKWDEAHRLVQSHSDRLSCLIHAYLHRVEGDLSNAGYWYRRADEAMPDNTLEEELQRLSAAVDSE
ncbi:MAG: hypothetical protein R3337_02175 [Gammaproteobacteria bacterium]|nr:hypothetical protein [Gammaproteobacteria bacterium]